MPPPLIFKTKITVFFCFIIYCEDNSFFDPGTLNKKLLIMTLIFLKL
jgi:hypothetical protein